MPRRLAAFLCLLPTVALAESGVERWSAMSTTATGITGDISLSPTRLVAAGRTFPLEVAADVAAFATGQGPRPARILKVTEPTDPVLLRGNRLCGAPVRWIAVYRSDAGKVLNLAAFSGSGRPAGEGDPGLCATFAYTR